MREENACGFERGHDAMVHPLLKRPPRLDNTIQSLTFFCLDSDSGSILSSIDGIHCLDPSIRVQAWAWDQDCIVHSSEWPFLWLPAGQTLFSRLYQSMIVEERSASLWTNAEVHPLRSAFYMKLLGKVIWQFVVLVSCLPMMPSFISQPQAILRMLLKFNQD